MAKVTGSAARALAPAVKALKSSGFPWFERRFRSWRRN